LAVKHIACLIVFACAFSVHAADRAVQVDYRVFPGLAQMDGNWAALFTASDGKVYIGLAYHGGDGHLVYYEPKTGQIHDTGPLTELCGEQFLGRGPQAKIHMKFGEGKDGRIYFGSHYGHDFEFARHATKLGYPGAHWMAFDPKEERVIDFGLGVPYQGLVSGNYDPLFNRIYGMTDPFGQFVYYDVASRRAVNKGRFNDPDSLCRFLGIDDQGRVFGSFGKGQVFRYDPRSDTLRELSIKLPIREKGISLGRDYNKSETAWRVVVWDQETRTFYGVEESATTLFSFDPNAGEEGEIRTLGQLCIAGYESRREVPYATLSLTLGKDRKLYYAAAGREFDYAGSAGLASSHLVTYDLRTGETQDHGEMRLPDGRIVIGTNSAQTAADGTIYFVGAIEVRPEPAKPVEAAGKIGDSYYRLALVIYRPR
jgi:outer membrane protein assembly factor BamB